MPLMTGTGMRSGTAVPFQRVTTPQQMGSMLNLEQAELNRIQRIAEATRFYLGEQWPYQREGGDPLVTINMLRKLVDKSVEFLVAEGFTIKVPSPLVEVTLPRLLEVWKQNQQQIFAWKAATTGAISGDIFVLVTYQEPTYQERVLYPHTQGKIRIQVLLSEQCFPTWNPFNPSELLSIRIETIYYGDRGMETLSGDVNHQGRALYTRRFTQIITKDTIVEQFHGEQPVTRRNALGEIPVVHWQNIMYPGEFYGLSDCQDLIDLQRELNEKSTDMSDIINYQGSPVTVISGAKARQLERGPKQIWSGLPSDAKVYHLSLEGDLAAAENYRRSILEAMYMLSDVPEGSLGKIQPISNTSGAALHTQFEPIIKKTAKKRALYEDGVERINYLILRIMHATGMFKLPMDFCKHCGGKIVETEHPTAKEMRWFPNPVSPEGGEYQEVPIRRKRCYEVDKQTCDFMDPMEMRLNYVKEYGFGDEVRDTPYWALVRWIENGQRPSFWDYAALDLLNSKTYEDAVLSTASANRDLAIQAVSTPMMDAQGNQLPPQGAVPPPPPPKRMFKALPPGFVDVPEEPEEVITIEYLVNPVTGQFIQERKVKRFVVPTGCKTPDYLNPFENEVDFMDTLPKDDAMRAQLIQNYINMGIVDAYWAQDHIPEVAEDVETLRQRMRSAREQVVSAQVAAGSSFQEAAPPPQKPDGDPTASGPQSPDNAAQSVAASAQASQKEVT